MSAAVLPFDYNGTEVRTLTIDGEPWFVLSDLVRVLGLSNSRMVSQRLDDDVSRAYPIPDALGRVQETAVVNEPGMYEVVIRSDKPQAAQFRWWLTHEVIPAIRKHGVYATEGAVDAMLADPDSMIRTLTALRDERAARQTAEAQVEADRPKVIFADAVAASHTAILVGDLAKIMRGNGIPIGANRLFARLREDGYLIRRQGTDWNMPTQRAMELGLFEVKETAITHSDGHVTVSKTPKVTGRGQQYFINRYAGVTA